MKNNGKLLSYIRGERVRTQLRSSWPNWKTVKNGNQPIRKYNRECNQKSKEVLVVIKKMKIWCNFFNNLIKWKWHIHKILFQSFINTKCFKKVQFMYRREFKNYFSWTDIKRVCFISQQSLIIEELFVSSKFTYSGIFKVVLKFILS